MPRRVERARRGAAGGDAEGAWGLPLRRLLAVGLGLALLGLALRAAPGFQPPPAPRPRTAALVDQVALVAPNPAFTDEAVGLLNAAGFDVDVYTGRRVTVDFLRGLPEQGYQFILFRTHSTADFRPPAPPGRPVFLYTGEPHSRYRYPAEQVQGALMAGRLLDEPGAPALFIVGPRFVRETMRGRFAGTTVVLGGCDSLTTPELAQAFVARGAGAVIGWDGLVETGHNDRALLSLTRSLVAEGATPEQAIARVGQALGPDPVFRSHLTLYPAPAPGARAGSTSPPRP